MTPLLRCPECLGPVAHAAGESRCSGCGTEYANEDGIPHMIGRSSKLRDSEVRTQDYVTDFYEDIRYRVPASRRYHEHLLKQMVKLGKPHGAMLDVGCGNGVLLEYLAQRDYPVTEYVGIDVSSAMLAHARRRVHTLAPAAACSLIRADACRLPFADEAFDVVFARGLLHHLPDPKAGVVQLARVLKPNGHAVVLDPHRNVISELLRRPLRGGKHFDSDHKNFTRRELEALLTDPLRVDGVLHFGFLAYPLLGFPDLLDFGKVVPLELLASRLIALDDWLGRLPAVRQLSFGLIMLASKVANSERAA